SVAHNKAKIFKAFLVAISLTIAWGCSPSEKRVMILEEGPPPSKCKSTGPAALVGDEAPPSDANPTQVSASAQNVYFYDDIVAIDQEHRCSVCHRHYAQPSGWNNQQSMQLALDYIRGKVPNKP